MVVGAHVVQGTVTMVETVTSVGIPVGEVEETAAIVVDVAGTVAGTVFVSVGMPVTGHGMVVTMVTEEQVSQVAVTMVVVVNELTIAVVKPTSVVGGVPPVTEAVLSTALMLVLVLVSVGIPVVHSGIPATP